MRIRKLDISQPEPTPEYTSFEDCVRWHGQVTIDATAREICALEFGLGGDTVDVPMDEPLEPYRQINVGGGPTG